MGRRIEGSEIGNASNRVHEDIHLPIISYGACKKSNCYVVDYLGDGLCSKCWDRTGMPNTRSRKNKDEDI